MQALNDHDIKQPEKALDLIQGQCRELDVVDLLSFFILTTHLS